MSELDLQISSASVEGPLILKEITSAEAKRLSWNLTLFEDDGGPNYRFVPRDGARVFRCAGESAAEADDAVEFFL